MVDVKLGGIVSKSNKNKSYKYNMISQILINLHFWINV